MKKLISLFSVIILLSSYAHASLTVDRTRIIYEEEKNGVSVVVENTDPKDPFLAQAWIETSEGEKINGPLIALPLLQRIDPNQKKQIRVSTLNSDISLPQDRESLFYFNLLGIPPKSGLENVVEIVIQSRFKLFYRPQGLPKYVDNNWQKELSVERKANQLILNNPTPYHIVIININNSAQKVKDFEEIILKPFASTTYQLNKQLASQPNIVIVYIDDYGAIQQLDYSCKSTSCTLNKKP